MPSTAANNAVLANAQAQILKVTALKLYNDAGLLLGNIAALSGGGNVIPDTGDMAGTIAALNTQLLFIDNQILNLQQSTNG